ncbi:lebercilin isoform X2 [Toxorhynchites rutilus septentrionalis]|uniref:lebercilin isoform X2 n=1 Tax=Toxorhynchites rutilus septentrionalis TaxID=329112 RepID=UPI002478C039|nr:lebercilin isoform X2 [Toxorhynchites rutilus septentrionalis]
MTSSSMRSSISMRSMESLYSSKSSNFSALHRRKAVAARQPAIVIAANSDVRHRVMSARMLRFKQLQNQLEVAHHQIAELTKDNRLLRALQKRQDSALSKYENSNAELPKLLHSHAEEIRTYQTKCRNLQNQHKEVLNKLKQKDAHILTITDQNKHLIQLNKDKHLEERERLAERVRDLETRLIEKDNDAKLLARRLQLESKNFRGQLQQEILKQREISQKLERAHHEIQRLNSVIEIYEKRTPSTLLKNSYLLKQSKPTSGQLSRLPNGSPTKPSFPNLAEPAPVTNMEIAPKKASDEGDGDHKFFTHSPKMLKPIDVNDDITPVATPVKSSRPKKKHLNTKTREEPEKQVEENCEKASDHHYDESFCEKFNKYALQQEAEFDETIEDEISRLKQDISLGSSTNNLSRRMKQHFITAEVSYEDDYEPESSPEKNRGKNDVIFDHKTHINELEKQIRNMGGPLLNGISGKDNKYDEKKNSTSGDTDLESSTNTSDSSKEFETMKREIRESIMKKESLLDSFCDEINGKETSSKTTNGRIKDFQKRPQIDPKKKKNLLEALKAIDGNSFDK